MKKLLHIIVCMILFSASLMAQQNPQFTQYMYNPMTVNAGYTGSLGEMSVLALHRSQWSGIEGAPSTITLGIDAPFRNLNGIGLSVISDRLGPSQETYIDGNYAHTLIVGSNEQRLGLGLKAGVRFLSIDWSKGLFRDPEAAFNENINSELLFTVGAGAFYYTNRTYFGISVPNFLPNKHYDAIAESEAVDKIHYYLIGGHVMDLNSNLKFKPSFYVKYVSGGVLSVDVSTNFLLSEKVHLGMNYRWDESVSALLGFQISPSLSIGYAYDYSTSALRFYNSGSHEFFIKYHLVSKLTAIKSPRFF